MVLRIACPMANGEKVSEETEASVKAVCESGMFKQVQVGYITGPYIGKNRNQIINAFYKDNEFSHNNDDRKYQEIFGYDYLLSIDRDIEFQPSDVEKLLRHNLPIVSGAYLYRKNSKLFTCGMFVNGMSGFVHESQMFQVDSKGVNQIDWVGGGFVLVHRSVIQAMAFPWFFQSNLEYQANGVTHATYVPEDAGFCVNAKDHGFGVFVDFDVKVIHHI